MKKLLVLIVAISIITYPSFASTIVPASGPKAEQYMISLPGTDQKISLTDFISLSPKEYRALTGQKLKLGDKLSLKITQMQLKKVIKKDGTVDVEKMKKMGDGERFQMHWGGFFLGFFLLPIGIGITFFFHDENKRNRTISSLIGCSTMLGVLLALGSAVS